MKKRTIKWTEAHKREAALLLCRFAQKAAERGDFAGCAAAMLWVERTVADAPALRARLAMIMDPKTIHVDPDAIDREVRRVDQLARGVLVRETIEAWRVRLCEALACEHVGEGAEAKARAFLGPRSKRFPEFRLIRVHGTRIRRASR